MKKTFVCLALGIPFGIMFGTVVDSPLLAGFVGTMVSYAVWLLINIIKEE